MISVIIPTYNRAEIITTVIDSFLAQSFQDWECIIVDDHSTDDTHSIVEEYSIIDGRIRYVLNSRSKGAQGARNSGIIASEGDWIAMFDSDDYAYPNYLEQLFSKVSSDADVITSNARCIDNITKQSIGEARWIAEGVITEKLLTGEVYCNFNGTLIRKEVLYRIGLLDEKCPSHQEFDMHLRLSLISKYQSCNQILSDYYVGGSDTISSNIEKHFAGQLYIIHKHRKLWRKHTYRHFVVRLGKVWSESRKSSMYKRYRLEIISFAPEVLLYCIKKLLWK